MTTSKLVLGAVAAVIATVSTALRHDAKHGDVG